MASLSGTYEELAALRVLDETSDALDAALALFERHDPDTLASAAQLVAAYGKLTATAFDTVTKAFDIYWQLRDAPCD